MQPLKILSLQCPPSECPLIEYVGDVRTCHFSTAPHRLWEHATAPTPTAAQVEDPTPIAYLGRRNATLLLDLEWDPANRVTGRSGLRCRIYGEGAELVESIEIDRSQGLPSTQRISLPLVGPVIGREPRALPWRRGGKGRPARVVITSTTSDEVLAEAHFAFEVYVFHEKLAPYFAAGGVPLALLRMDMFFGPWLTAAGPAGLMAANSDPTRHLDTDDWPACVVKALYLDDRLSYNSANGSPNYTFGGSYTLTLYLDLFLSDMIGLAGRTNDRSKYLVNCYDLAGLVQVISSLGVDYELINSVGLRPFGYITTTRLIGDRKPTNNPLYAPARKQALAPMLIVDRQHMQLGMRKPFGDHVFLVYDKNDALYPHPVVLDSTAGPQTGTNSIDTYLATAIDRDDWLLREMATEEGRKKLGTDMKRPGTFNDMKLYQNPRLFLAPAMSYFAISNKDELMSIRAPLLKAMRESLPPFPAVRGATFPSIGKLLEPVVSVPLDSPETGVRADRFPCVTWTLQYTGLTNKEEVIVMIYVYIVSPTLDESASKFALKDMRNFYRDPNGNTGIKEKPILFKNAYEDLAAGFPPGSVYESLATELEFSAMTAFADPNAGAMAVITCNKPDKQIIHAVQPRVKKAMEALHLRNRMKDPLKSPGIRDHVMEPLVFPFRVGSFFTITVRATNNTPGHAWLGYMAWAKMNNVLLLTATAVKDGPERNNVQFKFVVRAGKGGYEEVNITLYDQTFALEKHRVNVMVAA